MIGQFSSPHLIGHLSSPRLIGHLSSPRLIGHFDFVVQLQHRQCLSECLHHEPEWQLACTCVVSQWGCTLGKESAVGSYPHQPVRELGWKDGSVEERVQGIVLCLHWLVPCSPLVWCVIEECFQLDDPRSWRAAGSTHHQLMTHYKTPVHLSEQVCLVWTYRLVLLRCLQV